MIASKKSSFLQLLDGHVNMFLNITEHRWNYYYYMLYLLALIHFHPGTVYMLVQYAAPSTESEV